MTASNPDAAYIDQGDGTVTHVPTGLMWKRCSEGQTWTGATCSGTTGTYSWSQALKQASASSFAGHTDWRLPNIKELRSLVEECRFSPSINDAIFPATPSSNFWSGSPYANNSYYAWYVYFGNGFADYYVRSSNYGVRLVRGGQSFDSLGTAGSAVAANLTPGAGLSFASQAQGTTSAAQTATLTNSGAAALAISQITLSGDFGQSSTSCGASLAAGANCAITITFTPTALGTRTGSLSVSDNAAGSPHTLSLTGTGTATVPNAPTIGIATGSNAQATVSFTAPTNTGGSAIIGYSVISIPAGGVDSSAGSTTLTHTITGLSNGTSYTFTVHATNAIGNSVESGASNSVTPVPTTFTVSTSAGANGSITPATQSVTQGNTTSFTITANAGYSASATGCGGSLTGSTYTTGTITAICTVSAIFTQNAISANLVAGWNLLGNSINAPLDVTTVFGDSFKVSTVWKWVPATSKWAFYAPSLAAANTLVSYALSKGYDVLGTVNGGEGFWVNALLPFTAQLPTGATITTSYFQPQLDTTQNKLISGWNLIATGDNVTPSLFNQGLSVPTPTQGVIPQNVTTLWAWDSGLSNWYFYAPILEANSGLANYITTKGYLDFTAKSKILDQTTGFWINHP
jgi:hypothetical protein